MSAIDIVIPCAGRAADLLLLLESLNQHCAASLSDAVATITVTDDRHTEELGRRVTDRFPRVRYVRGPSRGPAVNRNHGASKGSAPWILFLDDDCFVRDDLLAAYVGQVAASPDVDVFEGAIHPVGERPNGNHHAPLNTTGGYLWSCNVLVRRNTFESIGGFDEEFPFACLEDCDLRERLQALPAKILFADDAVVLHPWRSVSERELTRQIISHAIYAAKHPAFVKSWTPLHALRMAKGRVRLYRSGGFGSIPWAKYLTVAYDLVGPFVLLAVTRVAPLRSRIDRRFRNGRPQATSP